MRRFLIDGGKVLVAATLVAQVRLGRHRLSSQRARVPEDFGFKIARERASAENARTYWRPADVGVPGDSMGANDGRDGTFPDSIVLE